MAHGKREKSRAEKHSTAGEPVFNESDDPAAESGVQIDPDMGAAVQEESQTDEKFLDLERENKELIVRLRELEMELAETALDGSFVGERGESDFLSVVKDLEGDIDATFELKDALETDLEAAQRSLSEESAARAEMEARVKLLESQAALTGQLRQEVSFVEEERNKIAHELSEVKKDSSDAIKECNSLTEKLSAADAQINELEGEKTDLGAQVLRLKGKSAETERLRRELERVSEERDSFERKARELTHSLEATNNLANALKLDLDSAREVAADLRRQAEEAGAQIDDLQEQLAVANTDLNETHARLSDQVTVNRHLEEQTKVLGEKYKSVTSELNAAKQALRNLHKAAVRVRERTRLMRSHPGV